MRPLGPALHLVAECGFGHTPVASTVSGEGGGGAVISQAIAYPVALVVCAWIYCSCKGRELPSVFDLCG